MKQINAGKYREKIKIYKRGTVQDANGFSTDAPVVIAQPRAEVVTTSGYTLISSNTDFEAAHTRFTIRYNKRVAAAYLEENRKLFVEFRGQPYAVDYLNDKDERRKEIELQCKKVVK